MARRWMGIGGAVAALALAGAPAAQGEGSLAALWLLDDRQQHVMDWSGNDHHGVLGDSAAVEAADPVRIDGPLYKRNKALRFDGDDRATIPDAPGLEPTELTIAAVVRAPVSPGPYRYVFSKGALACETASYGLYTGPGGGLAFYVSDGTRYALSPQAPPALWDGRWHLVVGSYDGERLRLYVDRREVGTPEPASLAIGYGLPDDERFHLGDYGGACPGTLGFVGDIDAAAIWDRAYGPSREIE